MTWIVPDWLHSDHPGNDSDEGPDWVASIVNAIGASPFWNSTAIFIIWDDWGGWYDHVVPQSIDNMGPGFRVPLIVVSPYAKHGYVSHQVYETATASHLHGEESSASPISGPAMPPQTISPIASTILRSPLLLSRSRQKSRWIGFCTKNRLACPMTTETRSSSAIFPRRGVSGSIAERVQRPLMRPLAR